MKDRISNPGRRVIRDELAGRFLVTSDPAKDEEGKPTRTVRTFSREGVAEYFHEHGLTCVSIIDGAAYPDRLPLRKISDRKAKRRAVRSERATLLEARKAAQ